MAAARVAEKVNGTERADLPTLTVGAGVGGLSAAVALGQKGLRVYVLVRAPEIEPIGYGIRLAPKVFYMVERLGVAKAVLGHSHFLSACLCLDALDGIVV